MVDLYMYFDSRVQGRGHIISSAIAKVGVKYMSPDVMDGLNRFNVLLEQLAKTNN